MSISDRLDKAMKEAGFPSQSALSRASGVPQPTINRILKGGGTKGPETDTVRKLAAACNVSFEWLIDGTDPAGRLQVVQKPATSQNTGDADIVTADELLELASAYRLASKKDRAMILSSAKTAAERARRHRLPVQGDEE